jgi:hypothetical protein
MQFLGIIRKRQPTQQEIDAALGDLFCTEQEAAAWAGHTTTVICSHHEQREVWSSRLYDDAVRAGVAQPPLPVLLEKSGPNLRAGHAAGLAERAQVPPAAPRQRGHAGRLHQQRGPRARRRQRRHRRRGARGRGAGRRQRSEGARAHRRHAAGGELRQGGLQHQDGHLGHATARRCTRRKLSSSCPPTPSPATRRRAPPCAARCWCTWRPRSHPACCTSSCRASRRRRRGDDGRPLLLVVGRLYPHDFVPMQFRD